MGKKIVLGGIAVLVVAVVVAIVLLLQNINGIVKKVVERVGSEVLETPVTLANVDLQLREGRGTLTGLAIANPSGFSADDMFRLDSIALDLDPGSLTGPVYVIEEVAIDGVHILAEASAGGETNFQTVMKSVEAYTGAADTSDTNTDAGTASADILLAVEKFTFANSTARLKTTQLGEQDLNLPGLRLSALGSREQGLTPEELTSAAVSQVFDQIKQAVRDTLKELTQDKAEAAAKEALEKNLSDADKEKLDAAKKLFRR